jgi:hypothetical protein
VKQMLENLELDGVGAHVSECNSGGGSGTLCPGVSGANH